MKKRWYIYMLLNFFLAEVTIVYKTDASRTEEQRGKAAFERLKQIKFGRIKGCKENDNSPKCCSTQRSRVSKMLKEINYYPPSDLPKIEFKRVQDTHVYQVDVYSILKHLFHTKKYNYERAKAAGFKDRVFINLEKHIIDELSLKERYNEPTEKMNILDRIFTGKKNPKPPPTRDTIETLFPPYGHYYQRGPLKRRQPPKKVQKPPTPLPIPEETTSQPPENTIEEPIIIHVEKENEESKAIISITVFLSTSALWHLYYRFPTIRKKRKRIKKHHVRTSSKTKKQYNPSKATLLTFHSSPPLPFLGKPFAEKQLLNNKTV